MKYNSVMNIILNKPVKSLCVLFLAVLFSLTVIARADIIFLKNGKIIEGQVKSSEGNFMQIETPGGSMSVSKAMVDRVQRQAAPTNDFATYIVEVNSDVKKSNMERTLNFLVNNGYSNAKMLFESPYYKIQIGPFGKESEAISTAKDIDKMQVPFGSDGGCRVIQVDTKKISQIFETAQPTMVKSNIALEKNGAKAIADTYQEGYPPSNVIDGNGTNAKSRWISKDITGSHTLVIDFGEEKSFYRIEIYTGEEHDSKYILKDFEVQYWAGSEWKSIGSVRNNLVENPVFNFDTVKSSKVRFFILNSNYVDNAARVYEVKIISSEERDIGKPPTEQKMRYDFEILEPSNLLTPNAELRVKAGEWYDIPVKVTYDIGTISAFSAMLQPDAQNFWNDLKFRDFLGIGSGDYGTTLGYDTKNNSSSPTITGTGDLSFILKSRAPLTPGTYAKKIRLNLYNPTSFGIQKSKEIPYNLIIE